MAKLALAFTGDAIGGELRISVDRNTSRSAAASLGDTILLYHPAGDSLLLFRALGKVAAVEISSDGVYFCRVRDVVDLLAPQPLPWVQTRRARQMLALDITTFDAIVTGGRTTEESPSLQEAETGFDPMARDAAHVQVYRQVLEAYGFRCAVTGRQFPAGRMPDGLRMVFVRPRAQGGPVHVQNLMPMVPEAELDWLRGTISATGEQLLTIVWSNLSGEVAEALETHGGKLHLPADIRYCPHPDHLAYHRDRIFGR
jgi:hypothetical protein